MDTECAWRIALLQKLGKNKDFSEEELPTLKYRSALYTNCDGVEARNVKVKNVPQMNLNTKTEFNLPCGAKLNIYIKH